jgi:membrane fusion protein (multidrug efflux system)
MNATRIEIRKADGEANLLTTAPATTETRTLTHPTAAAPAPRRKRKLPLGLGCAALALTLGYAGYQWWNYARTWTTTDNAYIAGHIHTVSTRIAGTVCEVFVTENQNVETGALLARLDANELQVEREKALAALAQAEAQVAQTRAQVTRDEAVANQAQLDFDRAEKLFHEATSAISRAEFDAAKSSLAAAHAGLSATQAGVAAAQAQVQAAHAQCKDVELQLSYTEIRAPAAGRVGRKNVEVGNRVQPGQSLLAIVQPNVWVMANFKETQLWNLQPGQAVRLRVDGFAGRGFTGRVESLAPASGAQFALLPPDNATGNFTKIVQRVPVKIVFDEESLREFAGRIVPGMSVLVKVKVRS